MSILLPVNPPFSGWLVDGLKTVEWRKSPLPVGKAYIYETKKKGGCGMVIGEVTVWASYKVEVDEISDEWLKYGKVDREFLKRYAVGKPLYANCVEKAERYDKPIPLSEFIHPSEGCCDEGKCRGCKWLDLGNEWAGLEDDCLADFDTDCFSPVRRPPQSWCYVEDLKGETT